MNSPIARWNVGPVKRAGINCLRRSVTKFAELYPEFTRVICFNQMDGTLFDGWPAHLMSQQQFKNIYQQEPLDGYQVHWKLFPPRLANMRHEIAIDNDILIERRIPEIDAFLQSDKPLVYEGRHRLFGMFDDRVKPGLQINSGIYGVPPFFDLNCRIKKLLEAPWQGKFDEQGAIAASLTEGDFIMISQKQLPIVEQTESLTDSPERCGYHFVGLNYYDSHKGWNEYLSVG